MLLSNIRYKRSRGFSLLEISVVLVIVGILLAVGVPVYVRNKSNQVLKATVDQMASTLQSARTVARTTTGAVVASASAPVAPSTVQGGIPNGLIINKPTRIPKAQGGSQSTIAIDQYSVVVGDGQGSGGTQNVVQGPLAVDSSITVTVTGDNVSSAGNVNTGMVFGSGKSQALYFAADGTTPGTSNATIVLTNGINQFQISVSRLGDTTVTQVPLSSSN